MIVAVWPKHFGVAVAVGVATQAPASPHPTRRPMKRLGLVCSSSFFPGQDSHEREVRARREPLDCRNACERAAAWRFATRLLGAQTRPFSNRVERRSQKRCTCRTSLVDTRRMTRNLVLAVALALVLGGGGGCGGAQTRRGYRKSRARRQYRVPPEPKKEACPVTRPNGSIPQGEQATAGARYFGNGDLWTESLSQPAPPAARGRARERRHRDQCPLVAAASKAS